MKKLAIFAVALLSLGFVACDDTSDLGVMQTNPQEALMSANGLTTDFGAGISGGAVNLAQYVNDNKGVEVIKTVATENLPAGSEVQYVMQIANNKNYDNASNLPVTNGEVNAKAWDEWFRANIGRAPQAKPNYVRFAAYVVNGNQKVRLGGENTWYAAKELSVTPVDLNLPQEAKYYLENATGGKDEMNHSNKDQYDDPVFSLKLDNAEATEYYVVSESGKRFGVDAPMEALGVWGNLVENGQALVIEPGQVLLSINMETNQYMVMSAVEYLYTPGDSNGWNQNNSQKLYTYNYADYMGFAYISTVGFKFSNAPDWAHTNYGLGADPGTLTTANSAGNITVDATGLYWCNVNIASLTYSLTHIESCGLIGDFNGWSEQLPLTPSDDYLTWTGKVTFTAADGFKVRFNDDWGINLGGALDNLVFNSGDNSMAPGPGTYAVTLKLGELPYTIELLPEN